MEPDRYKENRLIFVLAMVCLLACLTLLTLTFYLLPYLFLGWAYQVPEFVPVLLQWLEETYELTASAAAGFTFLIFFVPALITGAISKFASNSIENHIYGLKIKKLHDHELLKAEVKATLGFSFKLMIFIAIVIIALLFFVWLIQSPTPS